LGKKMDWFRLYPEIRRDPKVRRLNPEQRWLWISVLCIASDSPDRGQLLISKDLPYELQDIADEAAMDLETVTEGMKTLEKYGLVEQENGIYFIPKWEERQYDNPSDSPQAARERKRKSREKKKDSQPSHEYVTPVSRPSHDTETETETESDTEINKDVVVVEEQPEEMDSSTRMNDPKFAEAYKAIESQFFLAMNSIQTDELGRFIDSGIEPDLIKEAVTITRKNSKGIDYFWGILAKCVDEGLFTLQAFNEAKEQRKQRMQQNRGHPPKGKTDVPDYVQDQLNRGHTSPDHEVDEDQKKISQELLRALGEIS
jgi:hypothetical protein